jgi:hypothetical protein
MMTTNLKKRKILQSMTTTTTTTTNRILPFWSRRSYPKYIKEDHQDPHGTIQQIKAEHKRLFPHRHSAPEQLIRYKLLSVHKLSLREMQERTDPDYVMHLLQLWTVQRWPDGRPGRCGVSGLQMEWREPSTAFESLQLIAVGKIDPCKKRAPGNVVLVCSWVAHIMNMMGARRMLECFHRAAEYVRFKRTAGKEGQSALLAQWASRQNKSPNELCALTGMALSRKYDAAPGAATTDWERPSVDRLDNTRGHTPGNIRWTCLWANLARKDRCSDKQFDDFIISTTEYTQNIDQILERIKKIK